MPCCAAKAAAASGSSAISATMRGRLRPPPGRSAGLWPARRSRWPGGHVFPGRVDDQFLLAACDRHVPVLVDGRQVAGVQPAAGIDRLCGHRSADPAAGGGGRGDKPGHGLGAWAGVALQGTRRGVAGAGGQGGQAGTVLGGVGESGVPELVEGPAVQAANRSRPGGGTGAPASQRCIKPVTRATGWKSRWWTHRVSKASTTGSRSSSTYPAPEPAYKQHRA